VQWSKLVQIDDVAPLDDRDYAVLSEVQAVLSKHNCLDRFGVFLVHKHFDLAPDEMLVEYTDEERREQKLTVERHREFRSDDMIETAWRFNHNSAAPVVRCVKRCNYFSGHKRVHVKEGH
jgi:hypothetical protein